MTEDKKSYFAIIPADVRYDENLTPNAKLLYGEITALCNEKGYCWASNAYFAKLYKVSNTSVSLWIKQLKDNGYIEIEQHYKPGTKEILNRYLSILKGGIQEILNTPPQENLKENNTYINNTINKGKGKRILPANLQEVKDYVEAKNLNVNPALFYNYFTEGNWIDSKGNPVKNWKQKILTWNNNQLPAKKTYQDELNERYGK